MFPCPELAPSGGGHLRVNLGHRPVPPDVSQVSLSHPHALLLIKCCQTKQSICDQQSPHASSQKFQALLSLAYAADGKPGPSS